MRNGIYAQVRVRGVNAGGNATNYGPWSDASDDFLPNETPSPHLAVKNLTATGATLKLSHHTGDWWYKRTEGPTDITCATVASPATTATLDGLTGGVHYAYAAYSASGCNSANEIARLGFTTPIIAVYNWNRIEGSSVCSVGSLTNFPVNKCATAFTTGGGFSGYTLSEIKARFAAKTGNPADISVAIHAADTINSSNPAASAKVTLSGGNPDAAGWHNFSCSGSDCVLDAGTTYFVVMSAGQITGNHYYTWMATTSDAEDAMPANNGWSIANTARTSGGLGWNNISNSGTGSLYVAAAAPPLTATNLTGNSATLTFQGRTANWWYKPDSANRDGLHRRHRGFVVRESERPRPQHDLRVSGVRRIHLLHIARRRNLHDPSADAGQYFHNDCRRSLRGKTEFLNLFMQFRILAATSTALPPIASLRRAAPVQTCGPSPLRRWRIRASRRGHGFPWARWLKPTLTGS